MGPRIVNSVFWVKAEILAAEEMGKSIKTLALDRL
jgi:hypothetical protein